MTQLTMAEIKASRLPLATFGVVLVLAGLATTAWLVDDLVSGDRTGVLTVMARAGGAVFWFAGATVALSDRAVRGGGLQVLVVAFVVGAVALLAGLIVTPDDFLGVTPLGPDSVDTARGLGIGAVVVVVVGYLWSTRWKNR